MRPYGWKLHLYRDEDFGPATKHAPGIRSKQRHTSRRLLHKQGRSQGRQEIVRSIRESECPDNRTSDISEVA